MVTGALPSCLRRARVECRSCAELGILVKSCKVLWASIANRPDWGGVTGVVGGVVAGVSVLSRLRGETFAFGDLQTEGK